MKINSRFTSQGKNSGNLQKNQGKLREFAKNQGNSGNLGKPPKIMNLTMSEKGEIFSSLVHVCLVPCVQVVCMV